MKPLATLLPLILILASSVVSFSQTKSVGAAELEIAGFENPEFFFGAI